MLTITGIVSFCGGPTGARIVLAGLAERLGRFGAGTRSRFVLCRSRQYNLDGELAWKNMTLAECNAYIESSRGHIRVQGSDLGNSPPVVVRRHDVARTKCG